MKIALMTHRQLLRQRFSRVRRQLSVGWLPKPTLRVTAAQGTIFEASTPVGSSEEVLQPVVPQTPSVTTVKPGLDSPILTTTRKSSGKGRPAFNNRFVQTFLSVVIVISIIVGGIFAAPQLYYSIFPKETVPVVAQNEGTPLGGEFDQGTQTVQQPYQPPQDETLPEGKWLIIPRIGVRTELIETANSEEALAKGVWLVPEYGQPGDRTKPMIAAAHRFGWKWWWESDYWKYHSFNLLPELEPGDTVEVIADQRKWVYEIYAGEEGDEITDYNADLILYTCKFLNSPVRHFRYARLIDPTQNTQATAL